MVKKFISILFLLLTAAAMGFTQTSPDFLDRDCNLKEILKEADPHLRNDLLLRRLVDSGIPMNIEFYPFDSKKDLMRVHNPKTGEFEFNATPSKTPWTRLKSWNHRAKVIDVVRHYAAEAGGYRMEIDNESVTLLPDSRVSVTDKIEIEPFQRKSTHVGSIHAETMMKHNINMSIVFRNENFLQYPIDISFKGGYLKNFLNAICSELSRIDPDNVYYWGLSSHVGEESSVSYTLGIGGMPIARREAIFSQLGD